jgi:hypothetical protein
MMMETQRLMDQQEEQYFSNVPAQIVGIQNRRYQNPLHPVACRFIHEIIIKNE